MSKCEVNLCNNLCGTIVSHHVFPSIEPARSLWIEFCRRENGWKPIAKSKICSKHFEETDYTFVGARKRLRVEAIPSIEVCKAVANYNTVNRTNFLQVIEEKDFEFYEEASMEDDKFTNYVCRFCGLMGANRINLDHVTLNRFDFIQIMFTLNLNIDFNPYLSNFLCEDCLQAIMNFVAFQEKCKTAEKRMMEEYRGIHEISFEEDVQSVDNIKSERFNSPAKRQQPTLDSLDDEIVAISKSCEDYDDKYQLNTFKGEDVCEDSEEYNQREELIIELMDQNDEIADHKSESDQMAVLRLLNKVKFQIINFY